jgi:hypothetical protein
MEELLSSFNIRENEGTQSVDNLLRGKQLVRDETSITQWCGFTFDMSPKLDCYDS